MHMGTETHYVAVKNLTKFQIRRDSSVWMESRTVSSWHNTAAWNGAEITPFS